MDKFPTYEFRPRPRYFLGEFRRYANGMWIPDDGEWDLAFIGSINPGYPGVLYFGDYRENVVCSWTDIYKSVCEHPVNCYSTWHYALKEGAIEWGESGSSAENEEARRSGASKIVKEKSACNGRTVDFHATSRHILLKRVRNRPDSVLISCHVQRNAIRFYK